MCFASRNFAFNSLDFFGQNENSSVIQYLKRHIPRCSWNLTISQEMCRIFLIHYFFYCLVPFWGIIFYIITWIFKLYFKTLTRFPIEEICFICFMQEVKFFKTKPVLWWKLLELYQCLMQSSSKEVRPEGHMMWEILGLLPPGRLLKSLNFFCGIFFSENISNSLHVKSDHLCSL